MYRSITSHGYKSHSRVAQRSVIYVATQLTLGSTVFSTPFQIVLASLNSKYDQQPAMYNLRKYMSVSHPVHRKVVCYHECCDHLYNTYIAFLIT